MATTAMGFFKKATIGNSARQRTLVTKTSPADVIMFSGSKDTQTSSVPFLRTKPEANMMQRGYLPRRTSPRRLELGVHQIGPAMAPPELFATA